MQQVFFYIIQRDITQKLIRGGVINFLCKTHCLDLIYIFRKCHEHIVHLTDGRIAARHNTDVHFKTNV